MAPTADFRLPLVVPSFAAILLAPFPARILFHQPHDGDHHTQAHLYIHTLLHMKAILDIIHPDIEFEACQGRGITSHYVTSHHVRFASCKTRSLRLRTGSRLRVSSPKSFFVEKQPSTTARVQFLAEQ